MQPPEQQVQQFSLALKGAKSGIWDWRISEERISFSQNYYQMAGYEPDEFPHKFEEWEKRVHPGDIDAAKKTIQQYLAGELDHYAVEFRFKTKSGDWMWILAQGEITERDKTGTPIRFVGFHIDISQSQKAEKVFQEERAFSTSLVDMAQMIVLILDIEGRIRRINPYMETITGYKEAEVKGKDWFDTFLSPADHTEMRAMFKKAIVDLDVSGEANPIVAKDGKEIMVEWYSKTLKGVDGAIVGLLSFGIDITKRLQAEEETKQSERKFRLLADYTHDWEYWINPEGEYVYISPSCERISGYRPDEFMSNLNLLFDITKDEHAPRLYQHYGNESFGASSKCSFEFQIAAKNGEVRWLEHNCIPVFDKDGNFAGRRGNNRDITQKKQGEICLQNILKSAPIGIGLVVDHKFKWINPKMSEMVGYTSAEIAGQSTQILYCATDKNKWVGQKNYAQISQFRAGSVDTQFVTKEGLVIDILLTSTPLDINDLSAGITFTALDITERKRTEESLILSEKKFSRIFRLSPNAIALNRIADGTYLDVNQGFTAISGWQGEEVIGCSSIELGIWCRDEDRYEMVSLLKQSGEVNNLEVLFQCKDGHIIAGLFSAKIISVNGEDCILSITQDITDQKKNEDRIIKAKEEWEATFDAMSDMVTIHDKDMHIVRANKSAHKFFGADYGQLNGKKCCEAFWGSETNCSGCPLLITMKNGEPCSEILSYNFPNKTLLVTTTAIPNRDQQPEYYIHIARDITEQQQFEKEASRVTRLASLGELAAGVAHEINNPNALILYNSDILGPIIKDLLHFFEDNPLVDSGQLFGGLACRDVAREVATLLPTIHDSAQRIKRIVDDLRDFSSQDNLVVDAGVNLNLVVQTAVRLVGSTISKVTDSFIMNLDETLPAITGVAGRLDQVIINLLINACQALENRSQMLSISTVYDVENDQVQVIVADKGQGMTDDVVEHILEPFMTTKREQGGTGLGLSVSARIVNEHHGTLSFKSAPGEGTTATISLPVRKEDNKNG